MGKKSGDEYNMDVDVDDGEGEDPSFLERLSEKPIMLTITFIIFCGYGLMSVTFDWLWVSDMLNVQEALVFGPPDDGIIISLIIVASVGTVAFIIEIGNFIEKVRAGHELIPQDIAQIISLFAEEVPQITLNVLLASCREIPMSYYALVKAALAMFGSFMRSGTMLLNYIQPKKKAKRRGLVPWIFRTAILTACVYTFIGSCLVWIFTYSEPSDAGEDGGWRPPDSVSKSYDTDRYLYKGGIFFSHPNFAHCNNNNEPWFDNRKNWARLASIYDVTDVEGAEVTATFAYDDNENYFYFDFPGLDGRNPIPSYESCFRTDLQTCEVTEELVTDCENANIDFDNVMNFRFASLPKTKTIVFGDVVFNASMRFNESCEYPWVDTIGNLVVDNTIVAQMHYFRVRQEINDTLLNTTIFDPTNGWRYYIFETETETKFRSHHLPPQAAMQLGNYEHVVKDPRLLSPVPYEDAGDLLNVTAEWKTGYNRCDMSGSLRPNPQELEEDQGDCIVL